MPETNNLLVPNNNEDSIYDTSPVPTDSSFRPNSTEPVPNSAKKTSSNQNQSGGDETELEMEISSLKQTLRQKQNEGVWFGRFTAFLFILLIGFIFWAYVSENIFAWVLSIIVGFLSILMLVATMGSRLGLDKIQFDIEAKEARRKILNRFSGGKIEKSEVSYFDKLVQINVENLAEYYSLVKNHTSNSFRMSAISGVIGFILILIGMIIGFTNIDNSDFLAYMVAGSGILIEFISGIFFFLYNRTISELKGYHDSLLIVQNILLAYKIIEDIDDDKQKAIMIGKILDSVMPNNLINRDN